MDPQTAIKYGKQGGKKTLAMYGKDHFRKAAKARWKKWRLAKLNAKKGQTS